MNVTTLGQGLPLIGGADGPTSVFVAGKLGAGIMAAVIVIGLLFCLFGLKLAKISSAVLGFLIGASAGTGICLLTGLDGIAMVAIVLVCAVALAALSFFIYRVGMFVMAFICSAGALFSVFGNRALVWTILFGVISLALAVAAAVFVEPVIIIITSLAGGFTAGTMIVTMAGFSDRAWLGYILGAALSVIGIIIQSGLHSHKVAKKEKQKSQEIKGAVSRENDVEKARTILDNDEDDEE